MHDKEAGEPKPRPSKERPEPSRHAQPQATSSTDLSPTPLERAERAARLAALRGRRERVLERLASGNRELEKLEAVGKPDPRYDRWLDEWMRLLTEYQQIDDALRECLDERGTIE